MARSDNLFTTFSPILLALPMAAQEVLIDTNDVIPGVGQVLRIDGIAINDLGEWIVSVNTDNPDPSRSGAIIRNCLLYTAPSPRDA